MAQFKVVLTHKVKVELEAETPQEALEQAKQKATEKGQLFEPDQFSVKEVLS